MRDFLTYCSILLLSSVVSAQPETLVTKNFLFSDGIYLSLAEFQSNKPALCWEEIEVVYVINPQTHLAQIESLVLRKSGDTLDVNKVWAICQEGIPYIKVPETDINRGLPAFAALRVRGKICYFSYPDWRNRKYEIAAYNPLTGRPFRKGTVEREEELILEKMMDFESGELADFNVSNFISWIQDDPKLVTTVVSLSEEDKQEKLFKCLLIYVDRNPVRLRN